MSNPHEQQPFAQPGPRHDQQPASTQPVQLQPALVQYASTQNQYQPPQSQWQSAQLVPKQRNGLAVTALVVSCLALLLVLGLIAFVLVSGFFSPPGDLQGTAPQVVAGEAYRGALLADEVSRVIRGDFGDVASMTCPQTPVATDVVVECRGEVDGFDARIKVTFEDGLGHFTLMEG